MGREGEERGDGGEEERDRVSVSVVLGVYGKLHNWGVSR